MQNNPIGIFDSGIGGLSVFKEIRRCLPEESIIYLADSANCPYGSKHEKEARNLARNAVDFLVNQGCKIIVVACNTVTAVAIEEFRSCYPLPFIGMEPALKPAVGETRTGKIGVLATQNTFNGKLFKQTREKYANGVRVIEQPGFGLVELVEQGAHESKKAFSLLEEYLKPMMEQGADTLVLGCTHYPFLTHAINRVTRNTVKIIDSSRAVACQTRRVLNQRHLKVEKGAVPEYLFFTTGEKRVAQKLLSRTMDLPFRLVRIDI